MHKHFSYDCSGDGRKVNDLEAYHEDLSEKGVATIISNPLAQQIQTLLKLRQRNGEKKRI